MAIFGIGARHNGIDVSEDFLSQNVVGVGWDQQTAPELFEFLKSLKVGDIVYIKSAFVDSDITVKGIGIIINNEIIKNELVNIGRKVRWLSRDTFAIQHPQEKNNVRSNTVYEEFHPVVQYEILSKIASA